MHHLERGRDSVQEWTITDASSLVAASMMLAVLLRLVRTKQLDESIWHLSFGACAPVLRVLIWRMQFEGGVVVISHDSQLLSRVCDDAERSEVWLVEDGQVQRYDGYFEEYKEELVKEISAEMDED